MVWAGGLFSAGIVACGVLAPVIDDRLEARAVAGGVGGLLFGAFGLGVVITHWKTGLPVIPGHERARNWVPAGCALMMLGGRASTSCWRHSAASSPHWWTCSVDACLRKLETEGLPIAAARAILSKEAYLWSCLLLLPDETTAAAVVSGIDTPDHGFWLPLEAGGVTSLLTAASPARAWRLLCHIFAREVVPVVSV